VQRQALAVSKRIFIHVGLHKTGTTAVQKFLCDNAERLLRRRATLVPQNGRPWLRGQQMLGHHALAWSLAPRYAPPDWEAQTFDALSANLVAEIDASDAETVLLSSEELSLLDVDLLQRLQQRLAAYDLRFVVYVRRQDTALQSAYVTALWMQLQQPESVSLTRSLWNRDPATLCTLPADADIADLDYATVLEPWASHLGTEKLIVRLYERSALLGGDIIRDFCDACALRIGFKSGRWLQPSASINGSVPPAVVQLLRQGVQAGLARSTLRDIARLGRRCAPLLRGDPPLAAPLESWKLMQRLAPCNRRLFERWFPGQAFLWAPGDAVAAEQAQQRWLLHQSDPASGFGRILDALTELTLARDGDGVSSAET